MSIHKPDSLTLTGITIPDDACVVIIRTEWNTDIVDILEKGCLDILNQNNVSFKIITVPGAFEIGYGIKKYWDKHKDNSIDRPSAFIALGCVLRGDTPHFDYVSKAVTDSIAQLNLMLPVPSIFGVLTVDNSSQAEERTTGKHGNKGSEAAITALKMISFQLNV